MREELGLPPTAILVGTVGRLAAQKDPFTFLETAARVCRAHPDAVFLWVGDGGLRQRVEARIGELGLAGRIRLLGLREDVPRLLHAFDIFLLTSIYEGLARVLPEAMAAGKPVVATRVDGTVDAVLPGETGFLADAGDVEGLSEGVNRLVEDAALRIRLGAAGRDRAGETFSARTMTRNLEALYSELLVSRGGSA